MKITSMIICAFILVFVESSISRADVLNTIERTLYRSEKIQTIRMDFTYADKYNGIPKGTPLYVVKSKEKDGIRELVPLGFQEKDAPFAESIQRFAIVYSPTAWRLNYPDTQSGVLVKDGKNFGLFFEKKSADPLGKRPGYVLVERATGKEDLEVRVRNMALRCGTFPLKTISETLSKRRNDCTEETTTLEGITVLAVELVLSQSELQYIFVAVPGFLYSGEQSTMRLFVAPSFGYAIPRIEFENSNGRVDAYFEASGFKDCGNGVFFPAKWSRVCHSLPNIGSETFEFHSVSHINSPLDESAFAIELPKGTKIRSTLAGLECVFKTGSNSTLSNVDGLIASSLPSERNIKKPGGTTFYLAAGSLALFLLSSVVLWMHSKRERK